MTSFVNPQQCLRGTVVVTLEIDAPLRGSSALTFSVFETVQLPWGTSMWRSNVAIAPAASVPRLHTTDDPAVPQLPLLAEAWTTVACGGKVSVNVTPVATEPSVDAFTAL